jgi:SAM-dependent methyltransferase
LQFRKKFHDYSKVIKRKTIGINFGEKWQSVDVDKWYKETIDIYPLVHNDLLSYFTKRKDIKTVLEIGCGPGVYPIYFKELFHQMEYTGIDISKPAIKYCKENSNYDFICDDFLKLYFDKKYDFIFSRSVIDHVYDIDLFLSKIVNICKKYAYIYAFRGYFPQLENHMMIFNKNYGYYVNDLSVKQIEKTLYDNGLDKSQFLIRSQESGYSKWKTGTVIEINK